MNPTGPKDFGLHELREWLDGRPMAQSLLTTLVVWFGTTIIPPMESSGGWLAVTAFILTHGYQWWRLYSKDNR